MIYFTADLHLNHSNIIDYCNRPFNNIKEMNDTLIYQWNKIVKPIDTVIHNGDFSFGNRTKWMKKLNGNIVFVKGNHDGDSLTKIKSLVLRTGGWDIFLNHFPQNVNFNYQYNFVAHIHQHWKFRSKSIYKENNKIESWEDDNYMEYSEITTSMINIGVDVWDFKPISIREIKKEFYKWRNGV